jgi:hypothetical protein
LEDEEKAPKHIKKANTREDVRKLYGILEHLNN